jgi:SAM-dependent methyltransferase
MNASAWMSSLYDRIGHGYAALRRPDARIAAAINAALGDAQSIVNVGAGTGSYEPDCRSVIAVEPSEVMIAQRQRNAAPCVCATAEALPFESRAFDAAMAILTIHHWRDLERGLSELRRVARKRAVIMTWAPDTPPFWLTEDYFPELKEIDRQLFPTQAGLERLLESAIGPATITPVWIPHDCADGFLCAYWRRPESYLDAHVRSAISTFGRLTNVEAGLALLRSDLADGEWRRRNAHLLELESADFGYRLARCELA